MNRNLLLISIAAVVVVAVVAGVLLLGNGQSPALSGALATTTLTLNVSSCTQTVSGGPVNYTLSGYLRDANGAAVPGRTIDLYRSGCQSRSGPCSVSPTTESAVTRSDGGFTFTKSEPPTPNYDAGAYVSYHVGFAGDSQYAGSTSNSVRKLC